MDFVSQIRGKGPGPLLWVSSRVARVKVTVTCDAVIYDIYVCNFVAFT